MQSNIGGNMHNRKIESLKGLIGRDGFISFSFEDVLKLPNVDNIISDLIFLVGYNFIECEHSSNGCLNFKAGMFYDDLDEKLTFNENGLEGKLLLAVKTVYNVYIDMQRQSNIMDLYSPDMRSSYVGNILSKNKIDLFLFNQIQQRIAC